MGGFKATEWLAVASNEALTRKEWSAFHGCDIRYVVGESNGKAKEPVRIA